MASQYNKSFPKYTTPKVSPVPHPTQWITHRPAALLAYQALLTTQHASCVPLKLSQSLRSWSTSPTPARPRTALLQLLSCCQLSSEAGQLVLGVGQVLHGFPGVIKLGVSSPPDEKLLLPTHQPPIQQALHLKLLLSRSFQLNGLWLPDGTHSWLQLGRVEHWVESEVGGQVQLPGLTSDLGSDGEGASPLGGKLPGP